MIKYAREDRVLDLQRIIINNNIPKNYEAIREYVGEQKHIRIMEFGERKMEIEDGFIADTLFDLRDAWRAAKEVPTFFIEIFMKNEIFIQKQIELLFLEKVDYICTFVAKTQKGTSNPINSDKRFPRNLGGGKIYSFFRIISEPARNNLYCEEQIDYAREKMIETGYFKKNEKVNKCNTALIFVKKRIQK